MSDRPCYSVCSSMLMLQCGLKTVDTSIIQQGNYLLCKTGLALAIRYRRLLCMLSIQPFESWKKAVCAGVLSMIWFVHFSPAGLSGLAVACLTAVLEILS